MFKFIAKKLKFLSAQNKSANAITKNKEPKINNKLKHNITTIKKIFGESNDLIIREITTGYKENLNIAIIYIDGMTDRASISDNILKPLMFDVHFKNEKITHHINYISNALSIGEVEKTDSLNRVITAILAGDTVLLVDGLKEGLTIDTKGWEVRPIQEPDTERGVRGPREGFTETLRMNTTLLRRKIQNPKLSFEVLVLGEHTQATVCISYIRDLVNPKLLEEVKLRLNRIDTKAILESGYISEFIEDAPFSVFSTIANSERPDKVAAKILEGRVAILVDGTPIVLTVPTLFIEGFQASEDYYSRPYYDSLVRLIRLVGFIIALLLPAVYVSLHSFHRELVPTPLLITMAEQAQGTPFPVLLEILLMGFIFEVLREAGVRLPNQIGPAITIVGSLIIGDAAVTAGLVGAPVIIIIALTALCTFLVVPHIDAVSTLRYVLVIMAGVLGGLGVAIGTIAIIIHLSSLRSFGVPYLSPFAPITTKDLTDSAIRAPLWAMLKKPRILSFDKESQREDLDLIPLPPKERK